LATLRLVPFIFCDKMQLIILTKKEKRKKKKEKRKGKHLYSIDPYIDDVVINHMGWINKGCHHLFYFT
jgi:hypothetical protein